MVGVSEVRCGEKCFLLSFKSDPGLFRKLNTETISIR